MCFYGTAAQVRHFFLKTMLKPLRLCFSGLYGGFGRIMSVALLVVDWLFFLLYAVSYAQFLLYVAEHRLVKFERNSDDEAFDDEGDDYEMGAEIQFYAEMCIVSPGCLILWLHSNYLDTLQEIMGSDAMKRLRHKEYQVWRYFYDVNFDAIQGAVTTVLLLEVAGEDSGDFVAFSPPAELAISYTLVFVVEILSNCFVSQKLYSACEHRKGNYETSQTAFTAAPNVETNANAQNGQWICPLCEVENLNKLMSCVECGYKIDGDNDSDGVENQLVSTARPRLDLLMLFVGLIPVAHDLSEYDGVLPEDGLDILTGVIQVFVIINAACIALQLLIARDTKGLIAVLLDLLQVFIHMLAYVLLLSPFIFLCWIARWIYRYGRKSSTSDETILGAMDNSYTEVALPLLEYNFITLRNKDMGKLYFLIYEVCTDFDRR